MIRSITLIACLVLASPAISQEQVGRPALKAEAVVSSDIVRIGDLIENAGAVSDIAIFRAPDLGQSGAVLAGRVVDAVRPHHIFGLDTRGLAEIVVTRASRTITTNDFDTRVVRALAGQYGSAEATNLTVIFDNEPRTVHVEPNSGNLRISRLTFEPRTGRFDVSFEAPGSTAARRAPLRFTGSLTETFEAAVPARPIAQGEVLKVSDVIVTRRPKAEFAAGAFTYPEQVVGLVARRSLPAGRALRSADLQKQELVARNENVTITYEVPGIVLTMRGQALESGAQGDLISVLNVQSKKTIHAIIIGPGRVTVAATPPRLAVNASPSSPRNIASLPAK